MNIIKATVILNNAADKCNIQTDLPCPFTSDYIPCQHPLVLSFDATHDMGADYIRTNFKIEPTVINTR